MPQFKQNFSLRKGLLLFYLHHLATTRQGCLLRQHPKHPCNLRYAQHFFTGRELWVLALGPNADRHVHLRPEVKYVGNMHGNEVTLFFTTTHQRIWKKIGIHPCIARYFQCYQPAFSLGDRERATDSFNRPFTLQLSHKWNNKIVIGHHPHPHHGVHEPGRIWECYTACPAVQSHEMRWNLREVHVISKFKLHSENSNCRNMT